MIFEHLTCIVDNVIVTDILGNSISRTQVKYKNGKFQLILKIKCYHYQSVVILYKLLKEMLKEFIYVYQQ